MQRLLYCSNIVHTSNWCFNWALVSIGRDRVEMVWMPLLSEWATLHFPLINWPQLRLHQCSNFSTILVYPNRLRSSRVGRISLWCCYTPIWWHCVTLSTHLPYMQSSFPGSTPLSEHDTSRKILPVGKTTPRYACIIILRGPCVIHDRAAYRKCGQGEGRKPRLGLCAFFFFLLHYSPMLKDFGMYYINIML